MSKRMTVLFWIVCIGAAVLFVWLSRGAIAASMKENDERDQHPGSFIRVIEIKDTPEGVRCFAPAFYGEPPSAKSGVTCVIVWEGRAK